MLAISLRWLRRATAFGSLASLGSVATQGSLGTVWLAGLPPGVPTAVIEHAGRILVGTDRGLYREEATGWSLVLTRGGVRDLASSERETLIATASGLYVWPSDREEPSPVPIGAGARVRSVAIDAEGVEWVATEVGLFSRAPGARDLERDTSVPAGEVVAVRATTGEVWAATRGALRVRRGAGGFEEVLRELESGWWELLDAQETPAGTLLCVPKGLWRLTPDGARRLELPIGELRAAAWEEDALWVASERGLYRAPLVDLEYASLAPALDVGANDLSLASRRILVATSRGVAALPLGSSGGRAPALRHAERGPSDLEGGEQEAPDIGTLQRAVLRYLELVPAHMAGLEARARNAPLLPQVRASLSADRDHGRGQKRDQVFTSGDLHDLLDVDSQRDRNLSLELQLVWDLDELAAPDRALAVSKERRELIELRDQVLDRVNRLYFERLRVLASLRALPEEREAERAGLELRAKELAAGLDAWSGGLFSRLEDSSPPSARRP